MPYYPIFLELSNKKCLVVGGGEVAERKVESLLESLADVTVVSPKVTERIRALADSDKVTLILRDFEPQDLGEMMLVIAATDDRAVNSEISDLAQRRRMLVNIVDDPELCNFIVPATVRRGDLQICVSTSGGSPMLAKRIRREIEAKYGVEYGEFLSLLSEARDVVKAKYTNQKDREAAFQRLLESDILAKLTVGDAEGARTRVNECI